MSLVRDASRSPLHFACAFIPTPQGDSAHGSIADLLGPEAFLEEDPAAAAAAALSPRPPAAGQGPEQPVPGAAAVSGAPGGQPSGGGAPSAPFASLQLHLPARLHGPTSAPAVTASGESLSPRGGMTPAVTPSGWGFGRAVGQVAVGRARGASAIGSALARRARQQRQARQEAKLATLQSGMMSAGDGLADMGETASDARALEASAHNGTRFVMPAHGTHTVAYPRGTSLLGLHMPSLHSGALHRSQPRSADNLLASAGLDPQAGAGSLSILSAVSAGGRAGLGRDSGPALPTMPMVSRGQSELSAAPSGRFVSMGAGNMSVASEPRNGVRGDLSLVSDMPGLGEDDDDGDEDSLPLRVGLQD